MSRSDPMVAKLADGLASLRLAVALMVALAVACTIATVYESRHGTPAAQRDFYGTWWFALILGLLGTNVLVSMMKRWPWNRHHAGFVLAHVGILLLLAGSLVSLHLGLDSTMALYEGETTDQVSLADRALHVALPGHTAHGRFAVDFASSPPWPGREQRFPVPGTDVTLVAEEYHPHVAVTEGLEEAGEGGPALHFVLAGHNASVDEWLVAEERERSHVGFGPLSLGLHAAASPEDVERMLSHAGEENHVSFVVGPDGVLRYRLIAASGPASAGTIEVGKPVATPWMGMTLTVDRYLPHAEARRSVSPEGLPEKEERRSPAVKVRLEGPSWRSASEWLLWSEARTLALPEGAATVSFRPQDATVPFRVTLLRFNSDKYPGSNMAATYESWVRVEDPERGVSEHHVAMNHPLHYRGYVFFQSSFVEGTPMMSIFSVTRAPGLPVVYLGTALLCIGVLWMFYLKPLLVRRQAARAVAARRAAAVPASGDPVPARSGA